MYILSGEVVLVIICATALIILVLIGPEGDLSKLNVLKYFKNKGKDKINKNY